MVRPRLYRATWCVWVTNCCAQEVYPAKQLPYSGRNYCQDRTRHTSYALITRHLETRLWPLQPVHCGLPSFAGKRRSLAWSFSMMK